MLEKALVMRIFFPRFFLFKKRRNFKRKRSVGEQGLTGYAR